MLRVTWDPQHKQLLGDVRHHATKVDVNLIRLEANPLLIGPQLWWYVLTAGYSTNLELEALQEHDARHQWLPYHELMAQFLKWAAQAGPEDRRAFLHGCRSHLSEFGDGPVAALDFNGMVSLLAGTEKVTPKLLRVAALHWLSSWQAGRNGKTLAYANLLKFEKEGDKVGWAFGPAPLSCREWQAELGKHEASGALCTPDARTRLTALSLVPDDKGANPPSATSPAWKRLLRSGAVMEDADMLKQLDALRTLPETTAPVVAAALSALITDGGFDLGTRVAVQLSQAKTSAELFLAANSAWSASCASQRLRLRVQLTEFIKEVMTAYGPAIDASTITATLSHLAPIIVSAQQRGFTAWSTAAAAISRSESLPASILTPMAAAIDVDSFRRSVRGALDLLTTTAHHEALVREVTAALTAASPSATDWFIAGALRPNAPAIGAPPPQTHPTAPAHSVSRTLALPTAVTLGSQPPTAMPATSCVRISGLDACDPVESTSELSVALGTPVYIDPQDVSQRFGFATIPPELYNNLFIMSPKRVYTFPSGTNCTLVAHGPNKEPFVAADDNHLNLPPAQRLPVTRPKKRQLTTTPKLSKAQRRAKNKGQPLRPTNPPEAANAEAQLQTVPCVDQQASRTVQYARGMPWEGHRHG